MLGTRLFAGSASGAGKFAKVCLGSSGVPCVITIATFDRLCLPGCGSTVGISDTTHLPSIRTTRAQTSILPHDSAIEQRVNMTEATSAEIFPNFKVLLVPRILPSTTGTQLLKVNVNSGSNHGKYLLDS
ncbi:unnamed protein product [Callosobruchus maculatus]|uniref:Uncharacterized protein n=1 Tax=Callosobruchus maculatus TaxID=64391 RepID=A0A653C7W0_CALMS|nr:unnamed protein product [Callosobruchus maculatus]